MTRFRSRLVPLALVAIAACAHVEPPRGGPDDRDPPDAVAIEPDSLSTVTDLRAPVLFRFDERISERGVEEAVSVSPRTSPVVVDRGLSSIRVALRAGWEAGRVYHVTLGRTVQDLFNNPLAAPITVVFSTGAPIEETLLAGVVTDRVTGEPAEEVRVEAILSPDSLVYVVPVDSAGAFQIGRIPAGPYLLRAFTDVNQNRELDDFEARDSTTLTVAATTPAAARLSIVAPDTSAPRLASAAALDSGRVELRFDDYLDPAQELGPQSVEIADTLDGTVVAVSTVSLGPAPQPGPAAGDDADADPARPAQTLRVQLAATAVLEPGAVYRVRAIAVRNLVGLSGDSQTALRVPAPEPDEPEPAQP